MGTSVVCEQAALDWDKWLLTGQVWWKLRAGSMKALGKEIDFTRQGTQHSGTKLLSQPRDLIESRFMLRCPPLSISDTAPGPSSSRQGQSSGQ